MGDGSTTKITITREQLDIICTNTISTRANYLRHRGLLQPDQSYPSVHLNSISPGEYLFSDLITNMNAIFSQAEAEAGIGSSP